MYSYIILPGTLLAVMSVAVVFPAGIVTPTLGMNVALVSGKTVLVVATFAWDVAIGSEKTVFIRIY